MATSYSNMGNTGDRTAVVAITSTLGYNGVWTDFVDGSYDNELWLYNAVDVAGEEIKFDFGAGNAVVIDEAKWYQNADIQHGTWKWQGSDDAVTWIDIGSSFTLGAVLQTQTELSSNTEDYRYYRLLGISGVTSWSTYIREIEFKIFGLGAGPGTTDMVLPAIALSI